MQQISNLEGLGDIRAKLNSTRIYQQFETVADLIASSRPVPEGEYVGVPRLGHWYVGAASGASDHHLTNAYGSKLYVLPRSEGVWHFGAWGPDDTGTTDIEADIESAIAAALADGDAVTLLMPGGTFKFDAGTATFWGLQRDQRVTWRGTGSTIINMTNSKGFAFQPVGGSFLATTLAAAVAAGDTVATLTDATDVQRGDLVLFDCNVSIETGWNYGKADLRRIVDIVGNTIYVNKPFRWPQDPSDTGHSVTISWPCEATIDGIHFLTNSWSTSGGPNITLTRLTGGRLTNGSVTGEDIGWTEGGFVDGLVIARCMGVHASWDLNKLRYAPSILGSFGCRYHDANVYGIRHMDMSEWAEDCVIENIQSIASQGCIQSHPNTGGIFRNIHDAPNSLPGFDLRGLGETVEHCVVANPHNTVGGEGTSEPLIKSEWDYLTYNYRRTIKDVYAPLAIIGTGRDGWTEYDRVTAWKINNKDRDAWQIIEQSPNCIQLFNPDNDFAANDKRRNIQRHAPLAVPLVRRFTTDTGVSTLTITSITQASPGVVTAAGHGYSNDDFVYIYGGDMSEITGYYVVAGVTTDTFTLVDLDGDAVDTTSYTAYTTGGKATAKLEIDCIDLNVYSGVGQLGKSHVIAKLAADQASTFTRTFAFRPWTENNVQTDDNYCRMKFQAAGVTAFSETVVLCKYRSNAGATVYEVSAYDSIGANITIDAPTITKVSHQTTEGASGSTINAYAQSYLTVEVTVTATENVEWLTVEIEDWQEDLPMENIR